MIEELYGILREHVAIRLALWNCLSLCFLAALAMPLNAFAPALFLLLFCLAAFAPESMLLLAPESPTHWTRLFAPKSPAHCAFDFKEALSPH